MSIAMPMTKRQAERKAREIVNTYSTGAALTGWIPGSSIFLTLADGAMAESVAEVFGVGNFNPNTLAAALGSAVAGGVAGSVIAEGIVFVPFVGWAVKAGMMSGKAKVLGEVMIDYFKELSPLTD